MAELWGGSDMDLTLRVEIQMFMNEQGKVVAELSDAK
jgi:hypothetical protein